MSKSKLIALPENEELATREEAVEHAVEAYNLRLEGLTYKQIGERLEISESQAWRRCNLVTAYKLKGLITKDENLKVEVNDKLDALFSRWMPLAMDEKLDVGETRVGANDREYDISLPAWEASSGATKHVLEILREKIRINGLAPRESGGKNIPPEAAGEMAAAMFNAMRKLSGGKPLLKAEVVDEPT